MDDGAMKEDILVLDKRLLALLFSCVFSGALLVYT